MIAVFVKLIVILVVLAPFIYDVWWRDGALFVCRTLTLFGQEQFCAAQERDFFWKLLTFISPVFLGFATFGTKIISFVKERYGSFQKTTNTPSDDDSIEKVMAEMSFLDQQNKEGHLSPGQQERLQNLKATVIEKRLTISEWKNGIDKDAKAQEDRQDAVRNLARDADPGTRLAVALIVEGKIADGLAALQQQAEQAGADTVMRWRQLGRIAYSVDTKRALLAYEHVAKIGSDDKWDVIYLARLQTRVGQSVAALKTLQNTRQHIPETEQRLRAAFTIEIGDILEAQGDLAGALDRYQAGLAIAERLADSDPSNSDWQRDLAGSHDQIGNILGTPRNLAGARDRYQAGVAISERLSDSDPSNSDWQRDLMVSHGQIGNILAIQGDLAGALDRYRKGLAIAERLSDSDPSNSQWQRDLWVSYNNIGDILGTQGDLAGALDRYRKGLAIVERLADSDPSNSDWQRDLWVSHTRIGDILAAQGDLAGAIAAHEQGLLIMQSLAARLPDHPEFQRALAASQSQLKRLRDE